MSTTFFISLILLGMCLYYWLSRAREREHARHLEARMREMVTGYDALEREHLSLRGNLNELLKTSVSDRLFTKLPEMLCSAYGFPFVWIDIVNKAGTGFEIAGGYNASAGRGGDPLHLGFSLSQRVIEYGKAMLWRNFSQQHSHMPDDLPEGITTLLSLPLGTEKRYWGVLHLADDREHALSHNALENMKLIASTASLTVDCQRGAERLRTAESERRATSNLLTDAMVTINSRGLITSVNPVFEDLLGYETRDVLGQNVSLLLPEEEAGRHDHYLERYLLTGERRILGITREVLARHREGHLIPVDITIHETIIDGRQLFTGLLRDVSERKASLDRLRKAQGVAQEADLARERFLANMNHALRTPLSGIVGMADLLWETPLRNEQRDYVKALMDSAQLQLENLDGLIACAQTETERGRRSAHIFHPRGLLDDVGDILAVRYQDKPLDFFLQFSPDLPARLVGHPAWSKMVLLHLTGHLARHMDQGTLVLGAGVHETEAGGKMVQFWLHISATELDLTELGILEQGTNEGDMLNMSLTESGFNLQLARHLGYSMGGRFRKTEDVTGTRITFFLPLESDSPQESIKASVLAPVKCLLLEPSEVAQAAAISLLRAYGCRPHCVADPSEALGLLESAAEKGWEYGLILLPYELVEQAKPLIDSIRDKSSRSRLLLHCRLADRPNALAFLSEGTHFCLTRPLKQRRLVETFLNVMKSRHTPAAGPADDRSSELLESVPKQRVLVVEDNQVNQTLVTKILKNQRLDYKVVNNGLLAVRALQEETFDLVLMDLNLPVLDGFEATRRIRAAESAGRRVPIIAMTADVVTVDRAYCLEKGMDDFIAKPLRVRELSHLVMVTLQQARIAQGI